MNVLFVLSCLEPAGSETYCVSLARLWEGRHNVFWISDKLHFGQTPYTPMPVHSKAIPGGVVNTWKIARYIKDHRIDVVHSHSRRSHWVAAQAAALTSIPHVATVHQPLPVHFFSKTFPCLGDRAIAIDEAVVVHLKKYFRRDDRSIRLIRNGIDLSQFVPVSPAVEPPKQKRIVLLGRLTGGRWAVFQFVVAVLKRIGASLPPVQWEVAGRIPPEHESALRALIEDANTALGPSRIVATGWQKDLSCYLKGVDGVIAGGRSAMESMAMGIPVIALGEGGIVGACTPETLAECLRSNFGDHLEGKQLVPAKLELALREWMSKPVDQPHYCHWSRQQMEKHFDIVRVAHDVEAVYSELVKG